MTRSTSVVFEGVTGPCFRCWRGTVLPLTGGRRIDATQLRPWSERAPPVDARTLGSVGGGLSAQCLAVELANAGERERVGDPNVAWVLVGRQAGSGEGDDIVRAGVVAGPQGHERDYLLAEPGVGAADDAGGGDSWVL